MPGDTLLLHTDGLTEARIGEDVPPCTGTTPPRDFAADHAGKPPHRVLHALTDLLDSFGDGLDDDTALRALGVPLPAPRREDQPTENAPICPVTGPSAGRKKTVPHHGSLRCPLRRRTHRHRVRRSGCGVACSAIESARSEEAVLAMPPSLRDRGASARAGAEPQRR